MKILIACEFSGSVREAFGTRYRARNFDADVFSCDFLPTEKETSENTHHIQGDVLDLIAFEKFDMMIAFPPCTHLASSGARWFKEKQADGRQQSGIDFFMALVNAPIEKIAIENPIGIMSTNYRKPDQIIHPWQFGHGETKATCLWLKNLPLLTPTNIVGGRENRIHRMSPSPDRGKLRSVTYSGFAKAMADQWS